jgi:hypothetical protein
MGIFDDEAREMYKEVQDAIQKKAELDAAQYAVTNSISEDLVSFIGVSQLKDIDHTVQGNRINLRFRTRVLDITCEGAEAFNVSDAENPEYGGITTLTKKAMVRRVIKWLVPSYKSLPDG